MWQDPAGAVDRPSQNSLHRQDQAMQERMREGITLRSPMPESLSYWRVSTVFAYDAHQLPLRTHVSKDNLPSRRNRAARMRAHMQSYFELWTTRMRRALLPRRKESS
jgi:hypothetical protein